jgi:hypothetical protein
MGQGTGGYGSGRTSFAQHLMTGLPPVTTSSHSYGYGGTNTIIEVNFENCGASVPPTKHACGPCELPSTWNPGCTSSGPAPLSPPPDHGPGGSFPPPYFGCGKDCSSNGMCVDNTCACDTGFFGLDCADGCPTDWSSDKCACCPSGVFDSVGQCCAVEAGFRPVVDKKGICCSKGRLDGCGNCDGDGVAIDRNGRCCPVRPYHCCAILRPCASLRCVQPFARRCESCGHP